MGFLLDVVQAQAESRPNWERMQAKKTEGAPAEHGTTNNVARTGRRQGLRAAGDP